jgi:hypothetical protein
MDRIKIFVGIILAGLATCDSMTAQNVAINTSGNTANASAILDLSNTSTLAFLPPQLAIPNVNNCNPVPAPCPTGLLVYNTYGAIAGGQGIGFYYWSGVKWLYILNSGVAAPSSWGLLGNTGTNQAVNFAGTTDDSSFVFRTNATERIRVTGAGNVGVGTTTPQSRMDIKGGLAVGSYAATAAAPANGEIISGAVGIGTNSPGSGAMVDMTSANSGLLIPRVPLTSITDIITINNPAQYMMVFNTTTQCLEWFIGTAWQIIQCLGGSSCAGAPPSPASISGLVTGLCTGASGVIYSISPVTGATTYVWTVNNGATIVAGQGTTQITINFPNTNTSVQVCCEASNNCGSSAPTCITVNITAAQTVSLDTYTGFTDIYSTPSYTITTSNTNEIILIFIGGWYTCNGEVVTVDNNSATQLSTQFIVNSGQTEMFCYLAPTSGTHTIAMNDGYPVYGGLYCLSAAASFAGGCGTMTCSGNNNNGYPFVSSVGSAQVANPISVSITTNTANSYIFAGMQCNTGNFNVFNMTWSGISQLGGGYHLLDGLDDAIAASAAAFPGTYTVKAQDNAYCCGNALILVAIQP